LDLIVNVKPNAADARFHEFRDDLQRALQKVVRECAVP
jgi:hypothetical protein